MTTRVIDRAAASQGGSSDVIYQMVARILTRRGTGSGALLDIGCGHGELQKHILSQVREYIGADVIRYEGFPGDARFLQIDLDTGRIQLPDASIDTAVAVETIEHLENPRAFFRELRRLVKPGGLAIVTTPNQLSLLSKLTLLTKNQFNAFQEAPGLYPAHITALLEIDLRRIAGECGFCDFQVEYSNWARMPWSHLHWQEFLPFKGISFSDNVAVSAIAPN